MPFTPHIYVQFSGAIANGEVWSSGCRVRSLKGAVTTAQLQTWIDGIKTRIAAEFNSSASGGLGAGASLTSLKMNNIDATGHYADQGNTAVTSWNPAISFGAQPTLPEFCSVVVSLQTAFAHGRAHAGRQYWPNYALPLDGLCPPSATAAGRTAALAWHKRVMSIICNGAPDGDPDQSKSFQLVVASSIDGSIHDVTQFAMGNIVDVQRRRKNAYKETYVTASGDL